MKNLWDAEPTLILAVVQAGLALGMGFGLHVSAEQMALILTFTGTVLALVNRSRVTSPKSLQEMTPRTLADAQDASQPVKETVRKLPVVILAAVLGFGSVGCASARHVAVVADATFAQAVFAVDDAEFKACQTNVAPFTPAVCDDLNPKIKQALLDVKAVTAAIQASPKNGSLPKDMPSLLTNLTAVQAIISPLAPSFIKDDIANKIGYALRLAIAVLNGFAGAH